MPTSWIFLAVKNVMAVLRVGKNPGPIAQGKLILILGK